MYHKLEFLDSPGDGLMIVQQEHFTFGSHSGDSPSNHSTRATVYDNNFYMNSKKYVTIVNLNLFHASDASVFQTNSNYITYDHCSIEYANLHSFRMVGGSQLNITITRKI